MALDAGMAIGIAAAEIADRANGGWGGLANPLQVRLDALKAYCLSCLNAGDWHGVRDAAVDIEVVQARIDQANRSA